MTLYHVTTSDIFTARNKVAKVMFLHLSVCPQGGGVCLSACWDTIPLPREQIAPQQPATAADGTHPTGMHFCQIWIGTVLYVRLGSCESENYSWVKP